MIFSRHIYWIILLHVMLILVTSGTGAWLIISQRGFVIGTLLITCSLFQISRLVNKLNSFNQKLRVFFDAIEDKDNMLYFPEQNVSKEQEKLNRSLNRINFLLAKTQSEYSKQEHFYRSLLEEVPSGVLAWDSTGKIIIANSTALSLLDCQQLTRYRQLESLLQEKGKKEHLSLSQSRMKLQDETITLLSIKDIGDELSDKESESWNKLSHVLTHEIEHHCSYYLPVTNTVHLSGHQRKSSSRTSHHSSTKRTFIAIYRILPSPLLPAKTRKETFLTYGNPAKSPGTLIRRLQRKQYHLHTDLRT